MERKKLVIYAVLLIIVLPIVGLLISPGLYFSIVFLLTDPGDPQYSVTCDEYDGSVKTEWQLSDNVMGYEDIPEDQKENLSNDTRKSLKRTPSGWFNAANYSDLSMAEKDVFKEALTDTVVVDSRNKKPPLRVFYQEDVYFCYGERVPE